MQLAAPIREVRASRARTRPVGWYVFGSAALVVFLLQLVTGIMLAFIYVRPPARRWNSLQNLNHDVTLGWFHPRIARMGLELHGGHCPHHMMQVFLFGAYKFPRRAPLVVGVFLFS